MIHLLCNLRVKLDVDEPLDQTLDGFIASGKDILRQFAQVLALLSRLKLALVTDQATGNLGVQIDIQTQVRS